MAGDYVQYGCGWHAPQSWKNFDASPTLRFERLPLIGQLYTRNAQRFPSNVKYGDIVQGLPLADESCCAIYCSHVLEHLCLDDLRQALRNTYRVLEPGGVFRLVLPDMETAIRSYVESTHASACSDFLRETLLGRPTRTRGLRGLLIAMLGNNEHLWMWDFKGLQKELADAGFREIRRAGFGDSGNLAFNAVEQADRWTGCLGIECRR
jgi:SAM-dependent methyltransferase